MIFLRRFGVSKRNPNPPWPNEQAVVAVPMGVNASNIGRHSEMVHKMPNSEYDEARITVEDRETNNQNNAEINAIRPQINMPSAENNQQNGMSLAENESQLDENINTDRMVEENEMQTDFSENNPQNQRNGYINMPQHMTAENAFETRERPIMGYIPETSMRSSDRRSGLGMNSGGCGSPSASGYLCNACGSFVRIEFLFGENTHIEKTGILKTVGKDFIVLSETGTDNSIVCSMHNIKFINIYNANGRMNTNNFGMMR